MPPRPLRIALIGLNYSPEPTGIAPYTSGMARCLAAQLHTVLAFTAHPHYPGWRVLSGYGQWSRSDLIEGVSVHRVRHYVPRRPRGVVRLLSEVTFGIRAASSPWRDPDVVVAVSPALFGSALVLARARLFARNTPVVVWVQDLYTLGLAETGLGGGLVRRISHAIEGWVLRKADRVVVIHDRFASRINADFGVPRGRIEIIRNWAHLTAIQPAEPSDARRQFGWPDQETIVLHVGNMGRKQGLHNVVAAARLADLSGSAVRFVLLGDGSEREELETLGVGVGSLQFLQPLDDLGFAQALAGADILLVNEAPGVAEMAVPSKLTSYFSAGRPVLAATDSTGITADEVRAAQAGVVVPAGEPAALLNAALELAADAEARRSFGAAGRRYRESVLDEEHAVGRFEQILIEVTETSPRR